MEVATAVGGAFLSVLFHKLASKQVVDFFRGRDIKKEFKKLENTLTTINAFVNDAESKQCTKKAVKEWLDELTDLAYDAEDVLDEVATEALRKISSSSTWGRIWRQSRLKPFQIRRRRRRRQIESSIKSITESFDELERNGLRLGLVKIAIESSSSSSVSRETTSVVNESFIYGRNDDERKIIDLLLKEESSSTSHNNKFSVIPIVGMGGVGKTTLAQLVYNSNWVQNHYNPKAWVCVSDKFDIERITKAILESVTSSPCHFNDLNSLQVGVKKALTGKKFLIVLDDVWNKKYDDWDLLQKPFGVGAAGSAIIVTTRDRQVALTMGTVNPYDLGLLSEDDCWRLFVQHAFGIPSVDARPDLAKTGKEIARKCKGLPLAAKTGKEIARKCKGLPLAAKSLGGLLCSKEEEFEWQNVLNSKIWDLPEDESDILPVLKLSYYYLPSHLKRCFTYCSIFPKDYEFEEEMVVLLWMAEGFLQQPNEKMRLEDFGRQCFRELLSKSFFQPSSSSEGCFVMHDLMSDLALWAAGKTCFRLEDSWDMRSQCMKARHLSYIIDEGNEVQKFEDLYGVKFLRTFLLLDDCQISLTSDLLLKMKFLRVLSLPAFHITELPSSIGDMKHLRYIDISYSEIRSIPESVCTLYNLQTLLLKRCRELTKLPEELQKLINLRHFDISKTFVQSIPESVCTLYNLRTLLLNSCSKLTKLPEELRSLINLRHLDISNASLDWMEAMPPHIGRLTSLRKLSDFVVGKNNGCGIEELANLKHLEGSLRISKLENVIDAEKAKAANLSDKKGLNVLEMKWCSQFDNQRNERVENEVLDKLRPPHEKLKELSIICYGGVSFPTWVGEATFSSMVFLKLEGCKKCTHLPSLGQLPLLKDLSIGRMNGVVTVGPEFYGKGRSNPFPSLETLSFEDMKEWRDWLPCAVEMRDNLFALLQELSLKKCPNLLGSLPDHLPSLERLDVGECERLTVSISSHPKLVKLDFYHCQDVVQGSNFNLSSLKFVEFYYVSRATFLTEDDLENVSCDELVIQRCENLENLKGLHNWTSLRVLNINDCPKLVSFPKKGLPATLRHLEIKRCKALQSVSEAILGHNSSLELWYIESCDSLTSIARASSLLFSRVKELGIMYCPSLQSLMEEDVEGSSSSSSNTSFSSLCSEMPDSSNSRASILEILEIEACPSLTSLFSSSSSSRGELPVTLKTLEIRGCPKLESLGERFHSNPSLENIYISFCGSLKYLPENLHILTRLSNFQIIECPSLVRFPDGGLPAANLRHLRIYECEKLEALPNRMHDLTSLQSLTIRNCPGIVSSSFPQHQEEDGFPTSITELEIEGPNICKPLFQWGFHKLSSLTKLIVIDGCPPDQVSFPPEAEAETEGEEISMVLPSSIIELTIWNFPNLKSLSSKGFQNLTSLENLTIWNCPKLRYFPENGLPPSLLRLSINYCTLLAQRCQRDQGQEWSKISHVPYIKIDYKFISVLMEEGEEE